MSEEMRSHALPEINFLPFSFEQNAGRPREVCCSLPFFWAKLGRQYIWICGNEKKIVVREKLTHLMYKVQDCLSNESKIMHNTRMPEV